MGFWKDLAGAEEEFRTNFTNARNFRIQRKMDAERQALQSREISVREAELVDRQARMREEKAVRAQVRELAQEYNRVLSTPGAGVWDFKNHTITDKAAQELIRIATQIAALDPQTGSQYGRYVDLIYNPAKPTTYEPSTKEKEIRDYESRFGVKVTPEEYKGWGSKAPSEDDIPTFDQLKSYAEKNNIDPDALPANLVSSSLKKTIQSENRQAEVGRRTMVEGGPPATSPVPKAPTPAQPTFEEPQSENEVIDKIRALKEGKKPFSSYKAGRHYFLKAKEKKYLDDTNYAKVHNQWLSPAYPDTFK